MSAQLISKTTNESLGLNSSRLELNSLSIKLLFAVIVMAYVCVCVYAIVDNHNSDIYVGPNYRILSVVSIIYYLFLLFISQLKLKYFWFIVPIVSLTVPNAANDLFPSIMMGGESGYYNTPAFSLFTTIDIYFAAGVFRYCNFNVTKKFLASLTAVFFVIMTFYFVWSSLSRYGVVLMGGFQIRYLLMAYLMVVYTNSHLHIGAIYNGIVASSFFIIFESFIYTAINETYGRLASGNLGVNSLGHYLGAVAAMIVLDTELSAIKRYISAMILLAACYATGTRFSIVSFLLVITLATLIKETKSIKSILAVITIIIVMSLAVSYVQPVRSLFSGLVTVYGDISDPLEIEKSEDSSSMITRLILWGASARIVADYPILGIGPGSWSFEKENYGIEFEGLLDPHNDLINYAVSYGIVFGLIIYYVVLLKPILVVGKIKENKLYLFSVFIACIALSGLTNAVTWKHQIAIIVYVMSLLILKNYKNKHIIIGKISINNSMVL